MSGGGCLLYQLYSQGSLIVKPNTLIFCLMCGFDAIPAILSFELTFVLTYLSRHVYFMSKRLNAERHKTMKASFLHLEWLERKNY